MEEKIVIRIDDATAEDYFELEEILRHGNLDAKVQYRKSTGTEMGFEIAELLVLLPVALPYIEQLQKILSAYFQYRQPKSKKTVIVLESQDKKVRIEAENTKTPDINELISDFFCDKV